jgi:hypothetical protein
MSEQPDEDAFEETADVVDVPVDDPVDDAPVDDEAAEVASATTATGHPAVDEVLRSLEGLDGRPVDEHVAAFEQAHEQLRRALSDAGDDTP